MTDADDAETTDPADGADPERLGTDAPTVASPGAADPLSGGTSDAGEAMTDPPPDEVAEVVGGAAPPEADPEPVEDPMPAARTASPAPELEPTDGTPADALAEPASGAPAVAASVNGSAPGLPSPRRIPATSQQGSPARRLVPVVAGVVVVVLVLRRRRRR